MRMLSYIKLTKVYEFLPNGFAIYDKTKKKKKLMTITFAGCTEIITIINYRFVSCKLARPWSHL